MKLLERLLWITGVLLIGVYCTHLVAGEASRTSDIEAFKAVLAERDFDSPEQALWSEGRIEAYNASLQQSVGDVVGIMAIPRLELEVPVYDGASDLHMDRGAARIEGTAMPGAAGNFGVAGHRDGYFRVLQDIAIGDEITVTSAAGDDVYVVSELSIVPPSAVEVLDPTATPSVTLVTCYPFYFVGKAPERFIVRAEIKQSENQASNNQPSNNDDKT